MNAIIDEKFNGGLRKVTGWPIPAVTHDFFGRPISASKTLAGPIAGLEQGINKIRIAVPGVAPAKPVAVAR